MKRSALLSKHKRAATSEDALDLPQGTLDLLILKTLALQPRHGWGISERRHQFSSATLQIRQGSLYPALHRLERRGLIKLRWGASEREVLPETRGRAQLEAQISAWRKLSAAVAQVLESV